MSQIMKRVAIAVQASLQVQALTQEQFNKWDSSRKRQYLKDHPNSKFGEGNGKGRDKPTDRLKRKLHPSRDMGKLHPGKSRYEFTDNKGQRHVYKSAEDVAKHHDALYDKYDKALDKGNHAEAHDLDDHLTALEHLSRNKTFRAEHGKPDLKTPAKPKAVKKPTKAK